jgi:hypothetical protein
MTDVTETAAVSARTAAALCWSIAAGFGVPIVPVARHLRAHGDLPRMFGFRAYGDGPFERLGTTTFIALLGAYVVVCLAEARAGWLLWRGRRSGAVLALAMVPVAAPFWAGFALPIPPAFALIRTVLVITSWRGLRRS